ncbi:MAG: right-handed parallel beta-helix repeat-containing protein [Clostridia bacterium]|nr:right-handed parallel beta-helix repeat-containing protein [Clostridia bacterium]
MDFSIIKYGAVPDGTTLCTHAFEEAIRACSQNGGGYVDVPAGTFLTGTVRLEDNVFLRLAPGSVIRGSRSYADYSGTTRGCAWDSARTRYKGRFENSDVGKNMIYDLGSTGVREKCKALIVADRKNNCGIIGQGTIDGMRGSEFPNDPEVGRPFLVVYSECTNCVLQGVTLIRPGMFTFYGLNSSDVRIQGVTIRTFSSGNGDGLDFDGGKRIIISDCNIDSGDDSISLKTLNPNEPIEDVLITNCFLKANYWGAIRIGPESEGDIRRVTVSNCIFETCDTGFKIQQTQHSVFEDFAFSNIIMRNVLRPIFITQNRYNMSVFEHSVRPKIGITRRIRMSNITAHMSDVFSVPGLTVYPQNVISSVPGGRIEQISMTNVQFIAQGGGRPESSERVSGHGEMLDFWNMYPEHMVNIGEYPSSCLFMRHAKDVRLSECCFETQYDDVRPAVFAYDIDGLSMHYVRTLCAAPLAKLGKVNDVDPVGVRGEIVRFTNAEEREAQAFLDLSIRTDSRFDEICHVLKRAARAKILTSFDSSEGCTFRAQAGTYALVSFDVRGAFAVRINGWKSDTYILDPVYDLPMPYACKIKLSDGENRITVEPVPGHGPAVFPGPFYITEYEE